MEMANRLRRGCDLREFEEKVQVSKPVPEEKNVHRSGSSSSSSMDRETWMYRLDRFSQEYLDNLVEFEKAANDHRVHRGESHIWCPCTKCQNCQKFDDWHIIQEHLITEGFMSRYTRWSEHGELLSDCITVDVGSNYDDVDDSEDDNRDNLDEMLDDIEDDGTYTDYENFQQLIEDNEKPLYEGCKKFTKLSAVLKLFNLKANNGWSDKSFTKTLEVINEMLPEVIVPLFKCKWVENERGVKVDEHGFTLANLSTHGYVSEPFILARQASQVFFVEDPMDTRWHVVLHGKRRILGVENVVDEEKYDQFDDLPPFSVGIPSFNVDINDVAYLRSDHNEGSYVEQRFNAKAHKAFDLPIILPIAPSLLYLVRIGIGGILSSLLAAKRRRGSQTARKNKNHARLGAIGYFGKESQWDEEAASGVTIKGHNIKCKRARNFIFARRKRNRLGQLIITPKTEPIADSIIEKDIHVSRGELNLVPRSDVLKEVIGPEHSGRTRAVGHNIGLKESRIYKRKNKTHEEQNEQRMKEKIEASVLNERFIDSLVEKVVPKIVTALKGDTERVKTTSVGSKSSTTELNELHSISGPTDCELMLPYGTRRPTLAKGTVFPLEDGFIHSVPFEAGHVKVSVDIIYDQKYHYILLPVSPHEDMCTLGAALHSYIQWPRDSITLIKKDKERQQLPESNQIVSPVQQHDPQHPALSPTQNTPPVSTIGKQLGPQKHGIMVGPQVGKRQRTRQQFPQAKVVNGGKGSGVMMNGFSGG
ncbi:hypothetical protein LXL04_039706 [Taraxacum kok-saghyz]